MKKRDSIIQPKDGRCFLCGMLDHEEHKYWSYIEKHHVFFGIIKHTITNLFFIFKA